MINSDVIPGQEVKWLFLIARSSVDFGGLKHAADKYSARSCFVCFCLMMPLAIDVAFILGRVGDFSLDKGISHNPLSSRLPSMMTLLFFRIFKWYFENKAIQSSSHN